MTRFADPRPRRRSWLTVDVDRHEREHGYLGTQLTPSPEDPPVTWDHHGDDELCDGNCGAGEHESCRCWTRGAS